MSGARPADHEAFNRHAARAVMARRAAACYLLPAMTRGPATGRGAAIVTGFAPKPALSQA
ncbi:hypothetical protein [Pseudoroseicyclus sp. CXY001]|uniref:hypothetical protein n=1 Tax=Pseudoroseicyclus sp. CXY001 TaxID=3242492 RepID=UPI0035715A59